eukprot:Em0020g107a
MSSNADEELFYPRPAESDIEPEGAAADRTNSSKKAEPFSEVYRRASDDCVCQICYELLLDPVALYCGHTKSVKGHFLSAHNKSNAVEPLVTVTSVINTADSDNFLTKSVSRWDSSDVVEWVDGLGDWAHQYREIFIRQKINGPRLLLLHDQKDLHTLGIEQGFPSAGFLEAIEELRQHEFHRPRNFQQYKAAQSEASPDLSSVLQDVATHHLPLNLPVQLPRRVCTHVEAPCFGPYGKK